MKFDHLFLSPQWLNEYHTKYPHGLSVLENIIEWVKMVNDLIDWINITPSKLMEIIDTWNEDGTLNLIINEALQNQFNDLPKNVKNYGAKGDGVTDDTAAIRNALDTFTDKGGTLFFPPGVYLVTESIKIPFITGSVSILKPIMIKGASENLAMTATISSYAGGLTAFKFTGTGSLFELRNGNNSNIVARVSFKDFTAYGEDKPGSVGINAYNIVKATYENIVFLNFDTGIKISGPMFYAKWDRVNCNYCLSYGADLTNALINGIKFHLCMFSNNPGYGLYFNYPGVDTILDSCYFEGNNVAIRSMNTNQLTLNNCYFESNNETLFMQAHENNKGQLNLNNCFINIPSNALHAIRLQSGVRIMMIGCTINFLATLESPLVFGVSGTPQRAKLIIINQRYIGDLKPAVKGGAVDHTFEIGDQGILTDNTLTATTLGTVIRRIEIFNSAGVSLGFVPIYDNIS